MLFQFTFFGFGFGFVFNLELLRFFLSFRITKIWLFSVAVIAVCHYIQNIMRPFLWTAWSRFWNFKKKIEEIFKRFSVILQSCNTMRNVMIRNFVVNERNLQRMCRIQKVIDWKDTNNTYTLLSPDMLSVLHGCCVSYPCKIMGTFRSACFKINKTTLETIQKTQQVDAKNYSFIACMVILYLPSFRVRFHQQ